MAMERNDGFTPSPAEFWGENWSTSKFYAADDIPGSGSRHKMDLRITHDKHIILQF